MIVRIKGVKRVRAKGHIYHYHRKTMTRLPGAPGSAEFMARLRTCSNGSPAPGSLGSLGGLIALYRASPEFLGLAASSRRKYQDVFDELATLDAMPLAQVTGEFLYGLRDDIGGRSRANRVLSVLRLVFAWGIRRDKCKENPAASVEAIRRPRTAPVVNRPWRWEEVAAVLDAAPPWLRVPIAIAAYTGLRESDVLAATWACYDGNAFETRAQKTGVPTWVPAHSRLRAVLDAAPRSSSLIVLGARGQPISRSRLTTAFFDLLRQLRDEGRVGAGLSFHGLRHTLGTALAEAGCDPPTIAAVLGHASTRSSEHYSRTANRRRMAEVAIDRLENQTENHDTRR